MEVEMLRAQVAQISGELETREKRARQQGFQEGETAGAQKSAQQLQQSLQRIGQSVEETMAARLRMRQQMEEDLVKLAIAVARRILHRELTVAPEALLGIVAAALKQVDVRELHRLRTSPADARVIEAHDRWPERELRDRAWLTVAEAIERTEEPGLQELLRRAFDVGHADRIGLATV